MRAETAGVATLAYQIKHTQIPQAHPGLGFELANFGKSICTSKQMELRNKETKTHLGINSIWSSGQC